LSVVIVNYRHWDDTARLVRQLRCSSSLREGLGEIVIVDNHSPGHRVISRLRRLNGVSVRRWRRNRGFARAVNEGCRLSRGEWVLLLNPDMTLPSGFLEQVLGRADDLAAREPRAGLIGYRLKHEDGSRQLSTGAFPTLTGTLLGMLLPRRRRKYTVPPLNEPSPVDWVTGCCLLVRRDCWADLHGLDPEYFLYYEDVDLCRRARARGWGVWFDPGVSATHHRPLHVRGVPPHLRVITRHALLAYARKHWPSRPFRWLARIVRWESAVRRWGASLVGDRATADLYLRLDEIVRRMAEGRPEQAYRLLLEMVRHQEEQHGGLSVRRHSRTPTA
jgi:GT2 family glycosyltransferase